MIPSAAANRLTTPMIQNSVPNHGPTTSLRTLPSISMKSKSASSMPSRPNTVEYATSEKTTIVIAPITKNETNCSMFARFHQTRQRARFSSFGSKA